MQRYRNIFILALGFITILVGLAYAGNLNTSGKCPSFAACVLGLPSTTTMTLGGSSATVVTLQTAGGGDAALVLPLLSVGSGEMVNGSIIFGKMAENSIRADALAAMADKIIICGDSPNSGTGYLGPLVAEYLGNGTEFAIAGTACTAADSGTEGTADAPITADFPAFKVTGMFCRTTTDATNDQVFTLRSAEADVNPSVTCTVAGTGSATSCSAIVATTTDIATGATIAVKEFNSEDLSGADAWCEVYFAVKGL